MRTATTVGKTSQGIVARVEKNVQSLWVQRENTCSLGVLQLLTIKTFMKVCFGHTILRKHRHTIKLASTS